MAWSHIAAGSQIGIRAEHQRKLQILLRIQIGIQTVNFPKACPAPHP
jgi:hypothetical protein